MRDEELTNLARLLEASGVGWLLQQDRDVRLRQIAAEIAELSSELSRRLAPAKIDALGEMLNEPEAMKPLVQMFASPTSCAMRAMVYCVLRGMEISAIDFSYRLKRTVALTVSVQNDVTGQELTFESDLVWDAEILRHLGIMTMGKKPVLHGFYAFAS
ncbi:hypothetical protein WMF20_03655 [Sorangium sp. So ce834]|uniref:hypothetical protein n=1 Tax=Sorangium sp. So ce834 TaxID=3133321 RepID=UPI003F5E7BB8